MPMMCAVSFSPRGKLYYADPGSTQPRVGDGVLFPTEAGPEVATCMWAPQWVSEDLGDLPVLAGLATEADVARQESSRRRRAQARVVARRLVREHDLPMKIVGVDHVSASDTFTIYFSAERRIDFRALVRELNRTLTSRVHLRQLSARDSAKISGGIGSCGRDLCCSTFLTDFEPVSIRMAKEQNLALNPMRISGACGRLMCCLRYEHPLYEEFRESMPAVGERTETPDGPGRVVAHDVPRQQVVVALEAGVRRSCDRADVCGSRRAHETAYPAASTATAAEPTTGGCSAHESGRRTSPAESSSAPARPADVGTGTGAVTGTGAGSGSGTNGAVPDGRRRVRSRGRRSASSG
jgi:cell fate regulator YaaT (PSP1 superfamily)